MRTKLMISALMVLGLLLLQSCGSSTTGQKSGPDQESMDRAADPSEIGKAGTTDIMSDDEGVGDQSDECEMISSETGVDFPCQYFIKSEYLPEGYEIYHTDKDGWGMYLIPDNDVTLGPNDGVTAHYSISYTNADPSAAGAGGIQGISYHVLMFRLGQDKSENIEKIKSTSELMKKSIGTSMEYLEDGDVLLVMMPLAGVKESDVSGFWSALDKS